MNEVATVVAPTQEVSIYDDAYLESLAKEATKDEKIPHVTIGTRAGILSYGKVPLPNNLLDAIVIASVHANMYYGGKKFSSEPEAGSNNAPVCYAYSADGKEMVPHPSVANPQSSNCDECKHNQWGSSTSGSKKGKACSNVRKLALIPGSANLDAVEDAEIATLKVSVTSVAEWSSYLIKLSKSIRRPAFSVITRISTVPDMKSQFKFKFICTGQVPREYLQRIKALEDLGMGALSTEYSFEVDTPPEADENGDY